MRHTEAETLGARVARSTHSTPMAGRPQRQAPQFSRSSPSVQSVSESTTPSMVVPPSNLPAAPDAQVCFSPNLAPGAVQSMQPGQRPKDRFIPQRSQMNVDVSNYRLTKGSRGSPVVVAPKDEYERALASNLLGVAEDVDASGVLHFNKRKPKGGAQRRMASSLRVM
eukprot:TRINITY_DN35408_c0_g1_i1.p1 TRINITY_DN35408_c0_g1~~TRINITY_DN35408_c0_g1_i1.p1  ORF type:complete len:167 (+),score=23.62 TRINITY_DN35408_c0_g1_i1:136-636(+)